MSARVEARQAVLLVEVENGNAILRSAKELKPQEAIRMPIPYRQHCAYALANGKIFFTITKAACHAVMSARVQTMWGS